MPRASLRSSLAINFRVVGHIQQCISAPHHPEAAGEYMQKEKFGRSESVCPRDTYGDKAKPLAARSADGFAV